MNLFYMEDKTKTDICYFRTRLWYINQVQISPDLETYNSFTMLFNSNGYFKMLKMGQTRLQQSLKQAKLVRYYRYSL